MTQTPSYALDRHVLVSAVWLPGGFVALGLLHHGFATGAAGWVLAGFGAILACFALHVIVNAALGAHFTPQEVALSFVLYAVAGLTLVLAVLLQPGFAAQFFLPVALGMAGLAAGVIFYLVTRWGARGAFAQFDIIRDNNPRKSSELPHRGGRS
jgi:hypothetical protein